MYHKIFRLQSVFLINLRVTVVSTAFAPPKLRQSCYPPYLRKDGNLDEELGVGGEVDDTALCCVVVFRGSFHDCTLTLHVDEVIVSPRVVAVEECYCGSVLVVEKY